MKFWNLFTRSKAETPAPANPSATMTRIPLPPLPDDVARNAASMLNRMGVSDIGELNKKMFRSYEAAVTTSYNADFRGTYGSANAEILGSSYLAVARSRTLAKDAPHGKSAIRTFQNNVIGRGFRLKMRVGRRNKMPSGKTRFMPEEDTNRQIEQEYKIAGRPENFSVRKNMSRMEAFRILEASAVRDGSGVLRHHRAFPFNKYGYAADILENDRLDRSYMGKSERGNPIRFSIEFDKTWNFPVYYWPLTRHPGEPFGFSTYVTPGGDPKNWREEVPAADIIHYNNLRDRAEQDVGMTELDAAVQCMHRDRQYNTALALAAIASCCKPFWIKKTFPTGMAYTAEDFDGWLRQLQSNLPGPDGTGGVGANSGSAGRQQRIGSRSDTNTPASTIEMDYGQELQQVDPKFPIEAAHEFKADNIREMAVALGISYQAISGDFQNLGFSASRSCEIPQRDNFKVRQENFIDVVIRPHFREWLRAAIMSGVVNQPISRLEELVEAAHFQGVRWPFVNPLQDIQATILQLEAGLISPQQIQDELEDGVSIEDLYDMLEEAEEAQRERGLNYTNDPSLPTVKKGVPDETMPAPDDEEQAQPPAKTQAPNPSRSRKRGISPQTAALLATQGDGRNGHHF